MMSPSAEKERIGENAPKLVGLMLMVGLGVCVKNPSDLPTYDPPTKLARHLSPIHYLFETKRNAAINL